MSLSELLEMSRKSGDSAVEKLAMLRAFVPAEVDESTMSACLSACGYNVERAAEQLMMGQFTPSYYASSSKKKSLLFTMNATQTSVSTPGSKRGKRQKLTVDSRKTPPPSAARMNQSPQYDQKPMAARYLLCQRWISNGVSRSKNGCVSYQESLFLIFGGPIIRFKGLNVEGSLPTNLCAIFSRLQDFLKIEATALMEDRNIGIGTDVPLSLRIYIEDPKSFFALFQDQTGPTSATAAFFGKQKKNSSSRKLDIMTLTEAAFALLQWAEYGDVPEFKVPGNQEESSDDDEGLSVEAEFQANTNEEQTSIAINILSRDIGKDLPEAPDPKGLQGVTLRPYQRQALQWMMMREKEPCSRKNIEKELELLSELTKCNKKQQIYDVETEVSCSDSGPIRVSEVGAQKCKTLDGQLNPVNHPLWDRRYLALDAAEAVCFFVNELMGVASAIAPSPPRQCIGGMLCDEMGMGKTVQIAALILARKEEEKDNEVCIVQADTPMMAYKSTLVVAPMSLLYQWEEEIKSKTTLTHRVFYKETASGNSGIMDFAGVDVVITTYGTIQAEFHAVANKNAANTGILSHHWHRVVLDEAHNIKNPTTVVARACYFLKAECRWVVTGTPITNSLQDIFSLLKFLRHEPWCESGFWRTSITSAMTELENGLLEEPRITGGLSVVLDRVRRLLDPLLLRRTKDSQNADGTSILTLPPVETITISVKLSPAEREFYSSLKEKSQNIFEGLINSGAASKSWFAIFGLLQRLRQASCHIALTAKNFVNTEDWNSDAGDAQQETKTTESSPKKATLGNNLVNNEFMESLLTKFRTKSSGKENGTDTYATKVAEKLGKAINSSAEDSFEECPICLEIPKVHDAVCTPCAHIFCRGCLVNYLKNNSPPKKAMFQTCPDGKCPSCNEPIEARKIIALYRNADGKSDSRYLLEDISSASSNRQAKAQGEIPNRATTAVARQTLENALRGAGSAKLSAILKELMTIWDSDPGSKVLIFSQFLGFLDLIGTALTKEGIPHTRLDGSFSARERVQAIEKFKQGTSCGSKIGSVLLLTMKTGGVGLNLVVASTVFIADPWWNQAVEDQCIDRVHRIGQSAEVVRVRKFIVENSVEERIVELQGKKKGMAKRVLDGGGVDVNGVDGRDNPSMDDFKLLFGS